MVKLVCNWKDLPVDINASTSFSHSRRTPLLLAIENSRQVYRLFICSYIAIDFDAFHVRYSGDALVTAVVVRLAVVTPIAHG